MVPDGCTCYNLDVAPVPKDQHAICSSTIAVRGRLWGPFKTSNGHCTTISLDILQAVGFVRVESCPTQAVLPLVGLTADKVIRDRYSDG
ncbi:MAG: hypothetical protein ACQESR_29370 [Planctomycetota bacterium]